MQKRKRSSHCQEIIDVDQYLQAPHPKHQKNIMWVQNSVYTLSGEDRATLLSPVGWLGDSIISAAQTLLKQQSSIPGFQQTCIGMTLTFEIQRGEFIQILHDGIGHWLTISSVGCHGAEIEVYDSRYPSIGACIRKQIAALLSSHEEKIIVKMMDVQMQAGGCDCGLFAIAFATALTCGIQPGECTFKQGEMRKHLYKCLSRGELSMFPLLKSRLQRDVGVKSKDHIELFCTCRMPEIPPMVECSKCKEWYHVHCVEVPQAALDNSSLEWACPACC